jgi:hypothetical protein
MLAALCEATSYIKPGRHTLVARPFSAMLIFMKMTAGIACPHPKKIPNFTR